jgi:hypothetical protein
MHDTKTSRWKHAQPTAYHEATLGFPMSSNTPNCFTLLQPRNAPLHIHLCDHPLHFSSVITSAVRSVTGCVKNPMFICLSQVIDSPNKLCTWSLQGVHNRSNTDFHHTSNQPSMYPNCLYDHVCNKFCDDFYDHPPYPSALFHHKLFSRYAQVVRSNPPSTTISARTMS